MLPNLIFFFTFLAGSWDSASFISPPVVFFYNFFLGLHENWGELHYMMFLTLLATRAGGSRCRIFLLAFQWGKVTNACVNRHHVTHRCACVNSHYFTFATPQLKLCSSK